MDSKIIRFITIMLNRAFENTPIDRFWCRVCVYRCSRTLSLHTFEIICHFMVIAVLTDIDISACDSGLDTPPSTHRPSSYREPYYMMHSARDSTDTGVSSSRGTLVSPKGSIRTNSENGNALR